tara:strand:+ start:79 stop:825 length:747 start_codon:yes stop_codon:yes gene_type:complete
VQRRRRPKSEPRNIFDKSSGGKPTSNVPKARKAPPQEKPRSVKPNLPPITPKPIKKATPKPKMVIDKELPSNKDSVSVAEEDSILEEQLLGVTKRPTRGLSKSVLEPEKEEIISQTSSKAQEIIEATKARANAMAETQKVKTESAKPIKPRRKPAGRPTPKFQPATREKRLDRSRHMEYKYEMRGLLKDINVADEHHSALLGSIWAKGERQTSEDARQYIWDKQNEGILDDDQVTSLLAVVDDYTIRR